MPPEHGDAALRFAEPYWYSITGRKSRKAPGVEFPGPDAEFITEIFRSNDLTTDSWIAGTGMGKTAGRGDRPLIWPNATADKRIAPRPWHPDLFDFLSNLVQFWGLGDDGDSTDMDLVEWTGGRC